MKNKRPKSNILRYAIITIFLLFLLALLTVKWAGCDDLTSSFSYSASLDSKAWAGTISFQVLKSNSLRYSGTAIDSGFVDSRGVFTTKYISGGPPGAVFQGMSIKYVHANREESIQGNTHTVECKPTVNLCDLSPTYAYWYTFAFTSLGTLSVNATLDDQPWSGAVDYAINGPSNVTGTASPQNFEEMPAGSYALAYQSGGPPEATLQDISPPTINLTAGQSGTFTLNFVSNTANTTANTTANVEVAATLNGNPWSGRINFSIQGPEEVTGTSAPQTYSNITSGNYTVKYISGGPPEAKFTGITPADNQDITGGDNVTFTINFESLNKLNVPNVLTVLATLDGNLWEGSVSYTLSGPASLSGAKVSQSFIDVPPGEYKIRYVSGGPENAILSGISPGANQIVAATGVTNYTLEFVSTGGNITVKGLLSTEWSGPCKYVVNGPVRLSGDSLPQTFKNVPLGEYTVFYVSGGPISVQFKSVEPATQQLSAAGETAVFKIKFMFLAPAPVVVPTTVPTTADLSVTLTCDDYNPSGAGYVNYYVTVSNAGPLTATNIIVRFLPSGGSLSYVSNAPSQGSYNSATGVWTLGNLTPGSNATLRVYVGMSGTPSGVVITNTAEITAVDQPDSDSTPNNGNPAEDDQSSATITIS